MSVEKFYYVYVLFSLKDKKLYIGYTKDIFKRFDLHKEGKVSSTKNRRPLILIFYEAFTKRKDAKSREVFLKSGFGRNELKKCLKNKLKELSYSCL
jgi:putative endonuclease